MSPRRDRFQIATDILRKAKDGSKKTRIMYQCNLSFEQTEAYLGALVNAKFVAITKDDDSNRDVYTTTDKGIEAILKLEDTERTFKPIYERPKK